MCFDFLLKTFFETLTRLMFHSQPVIYPLPQLKMRSVDEKSQDEGVGIRTPTGVISFLRPCQDLCLVP